MIDEYMIGTRHVVTDSWFSANKWDVFISAYNDSDRVHAVYDLVAAKEKFYVLLEEYLYSLEEVKNKGVDESGLVGVTGCGSDEAAVIKSVFDKIFPKGFCGQKICVDITGFMRPHIFALVDFFSEGDLNGIDFLYAEPEMYENKENTEFSSGDVLEVRQISGFQGIHEDDDAEEVLIIGVGYDNQLISRVINDKESAKVYKVISFPSLSPDMYQEGLVCLERCSLSDDDRDNSQSVFAPANDAFSVASELSDLYRRLKKDGSRKNYYFCSLSTKPQALGFAIFYQADLKDGSSSVIFPYSKGYKRETSSGVGNIWRYRVDL